MEKIVVTSGGILLIIFIYWFFFGKRETTGQLKENGEITIVVEGGYKPSIIKVKKESPLKLRFIRRDPNSCLEEVVIPDYKIKKYLPMGKAVEIEIKPKDTGEIKFHCGMHMFEGKIIVV